MNSLNTKVFYDIHHAIMEFGEMQLWDPKCKRGLDYYLRAIRLRLHV